MTHRPASEIDFLAISRVRYVYELGWAALQFQSRLHLGAGQGYHHPMPWHGIKALQGCTYRAPPSAGQCNSSIGCSYDVDWTPNGLFKASGWARNEAVQVCNNDHRFSKPLLSVLHLQIYNIWLGHAAMATTAP